MLINKNQVVSISDKIENNLIYKDIFFIKLDNTLINNIKLINITKVVIKNSFFIKANFENIKNIFFNIDIFNINYNKLKEKKFKFFFKEINIKNISHLICTMPISVFKKFISNINIKGKLESLYIKLTEEDNNFLFNTSEKNKQNLEIINKILNFVYKYKNNIENIIIDFNNIFINSSEETNKNQTKIINHFFKKITEFLKNYNSNRKDLKDYITNIFTHELIELYIKYKLELPEFLKLKKGKTVYKIVKI